uniref:Uncharacterized protein n=1 Tax=Arion vulgaris TaxID=1028688 RepID=A0A0B7B9P4_9EUPU
MKQPYIYSHAARYIHKQCLTINTIRHVRTPDICLQNAQSETTEVSPHTSSLQWIR